MAKTMISIRLENSVLDWFKANAPEGYQKKINAVLQDYQQCCTMQAQKNLGRAQQIFLQYHARCFWHLKKDLEITPAHIPIIQAGLRKFGGLEGMRLAADINLDQTQESIDANH